MNEGIHGSHALWLEVVNRIIGDRPRNYLLDVCCGGTAITRHLKFRTRDGIDVEDHPEREPSFHFTQGDALELLERLPADSARYDVSIISDGLEHFDGFDGFRIMAAMERISNLVIIFVPTNDAEISYLSKNPHTHKSAWEAADFINRGYTVEEYPDWHAPTLILGALFAWKPTNP